MNDCACCTEKFNRTTRKSIQCDKCNYDVCFVCVKTYFGSSDKELCCMQCQNVFSKDFINKNLPKSFINGELKMFQRNLLFKQEKELMPATQEKAKHELHIRKLVSDMKIEKIALCESEKQLELTKLVIRDMQNDVNEQKFEILKKQITSANWYKTYNIVGQHEISDSNSNVFIKQCPMNDCKGYLSSEWNCGLCDVVVCDQCHEVKQGVIMGESPPEHVCDVNSLATAKELIHNTKSCPCCGTLIYKIQGCDQMWCIKCNTAFDWNTRMIVVKNIHNPHYYEWRRNQSIRGEIQREIGDVVCGGIPDGCS